MQISRSREFKANIDNYESFPVFVSVTVNHQDLGYTDEEWRELMAQDDQESLDAIDDLKDLAETLVGEQLRDEVERVNTLRTGTDAKRKSVLGHVESEDE